MIGICIKRNYYTTESISIFDMKNVAVSLQNDPESYEWVLSARSGDLKVSGPFVQTLCIEKDSYIYTPFNV